MFKRGDFVYAGYAGIYAFGTVIEVIVPLFHCYTVEFIGPHNSWMRAGLTGITFTRAAMSFGGPVRTEEKAWNNSR